MGVKQVKVDVAEVSVGMFVSGLDRPWTQTPFPLQGFMVREAGEVELLKAHCNHVYIDVIKGARPGKANLKSYTGPKSVDLASRYIRSSPSSGSKSANPAYAPLKVRSNVYPVTESIRNEAGRARELHQKVYAAVTEVMEQVGADHQNVSMQDAKRAASAMVGSVLRSPDAFTWLTRVKETDSYTYSHAVRASVWGILLGRHLGLPKNDLESLTTGILLKDIGKTQLPHGLIENRHRTAIEQREYEKFVDQGVDILRQLPDIQPRVITVVKTHCEQLNGTGFPEGLKGDRIPLLGKIAGIVTFYDKTTNPRGEKPLSPSKAIANLYEVRDQTFQSDLVVEFIKAIGLYPTGTIVELNTGEAAVIVEQNFEWRLKPKVMIVADSMKNIMKRPEYLDMAEHENDIRARIDSGKLDAMAAERIEISRDVEPGTYDIDVIAIRDEYLNKVMKKPSGILSFFKKAR